MLFYIINAQLINMGRDRKNCQASALLCPKFLQHKENHGTVTDL